MTASKAITGGLDLSVHVPGPQVVYFGTLWKACYVVRKPSGLHVELICKRWAECEQEAWLCFSVRTPPPADILPPESIV